jgi:hypothetical protein
MEVALTKRISAIAMIAPAENGEVFQPTRRAPELKRGKLDRRITNGHLHPSSQDAGRIDYDRQCMMPPENPA